MMRHILLLFTTWLLGACAHDIHKYMTVEELQSTFHVDNHDLVPEYEVVHISDHNIRRRRSISGNSDYPSAKYNNQVHKVVVSSGGKEWGSKAEPVTRKFTFAQPATANIKFRVFGRPLHLRLIKNEGLFKNTGLKMWIVEPNSTSQHGVEYIEMPESHLDVGEIYQDEANHAAILLRNDEELGHFLLEGSIGEDLVIKPLPTRLHALAEVQMPQMKSSQTNRPQRSGASEEDDDEMFLDDDGELSAEVAIDTGLPIRRNITDSSTNSGERFQEMLPPTHHIVFKRKSSQEDAESDYAFMEPDHLGRRFRRSATTNKVGELRSRQKREAPYTIYPEILVIVDYDGYRLHGGDNLQIKRYFVSFWNGVDLRYKLLKGPKIRVSIAGIIISRGRDATPYLERNRVGRDAIDSAAALTDMGKYLFRERRLPVYDIAVAITKLDMCRRSFPSDVCNRGTAGFAYVGGACVVNKRLEKVNSVAIIEDTGGFSGIIVAAHEVGHLLGAVHDGSPPPSYLGGPGAEKCQWTDGYIMSDLRHTERGFRWSSCSVSSFHHFLNGDTATCLYNSPHEDDSLPRVLPGKLLTLDAQCRRDRGTSACFKDDRVCAQLFCFDAGSGYCVAYRPAAEGSPCGDGQYCINGRCVAEHENIIPDYSQNTPSYIRRDGQVNQGRPLFYDEDEEVQPEPPNTYYHQSHNDESDNPLHSTNKPIHFHTSSTPTRHPYHFYAITETPYNRQTTTTTQGPKHTHSKTMRNVYHSTQKTLFKLFSLSTTRSPYDFQYFANRFSTSSSSTRDYYSTSYTTRKPYYTSTTTTSAPQPNLQSTKNPYIGNYYILRQKTTRSPYDFANFGRHYATSTANYHDNLDNNYLKRSYNAASYYGIASNMRIGLRQ